MNEGATSNIKQIVSSFDTAITIYENAHWIKNITSEDIKSAFKLGCFIEKTIDNFKKNKCPQNFIEALKTWRESNNKMLHSEYTIDFFSKMSDYILMKFFKCQTTNEKVLDVAIRMYTSLYPKERLQTVMKDILIESATFEAILDFVIANKRESDISYLKFQQILDDLVIDFESGQSDKVKNFISECLSSFKVQNANSLPMLIGILALEQQNDVTEIIFDNILTKMLDRSILSNNFWLALLKNTELKHLHQVCCKYEDFLTSLCNFLIYIGSMMEKQDDTWINSSISLCPEITYTELESIFIYLSGNNNPDLRQFIVNKLNDAQTYTNSTIFEQIKNKCL